MQSYFGIFDRVIGEEQLYHEVNHLDWGVFGCSSKRPEHSSFPIHYSDRGSETLDGSQIIEVKLYVYKSSWFKVSYVKKNSFSLSCRFSV